MKGIFPAVTALVVAATSVVVLECGNTASTATAPHADASAGSPDSGDECTACTSDQGCAGGACVVLGAASYCAPLCATADAGCSADRACVAVDDVTGASVNACVPRSAACGTVADGGATDAAFDAQSEMCGHLVGPDLPGGCTTHCTDGGTKACQVNGCYGGDWCDTDSMECEEAPNGGQCGDHGPGVPYDAGSAPTGTVGLDGGALSRLYFAVVGDTRPATQDDTANYPTAIITKIFSDVQALTPRPPFAISTGDYMFASPDAGEGSAQLDLYLGARANYTGAVFATMGNHECTGATKSNCGEAGIDGITNNYTAFLTQVLAPQGQSLPYYEIDVSASDASWTSKFLFVPGNAWSTDVGTWLDAAMSRATTYTFLVRHEGTDADTAPGVTPAEAIMANHPYTLSIVGHDHIYTKSGPQEVTFGNGGAPPTGPSDYGYGIVSQRADGSLAVDAIDYQTGLADSTFHFAVNADGSAASP